MSSHFISYGVANDKPTLLMHANAYNPYMYKEFVEAMELSYTIAPMHRPLYDSKVMAITDWSIFAKDLIQFMDDHGLKNVNAIGHSLGGIAVWRAAILRPDLFNKIILIDPVILPEDIARWIKLVPFAIKKRIRPIIKIALNRRNHWSTREEAYEHMLTKKVFKSFKPSIFDTFIAHGLREDKERGGFTLSFPREWEGRIYASIDNTWKYFGKTDKYITIIKAEHSNIITADTWQLMNELYPVNYKLVEMKNVGHLIPFEQPVELAALLKQLQ